MEQRPKTPPDPPAHRGGLLAQWFFMAVIAVAVLSIAAGSAPPRLKLLGLFTVVQGAVAGGILAWLARWNGLPASRAVVGLSLVVIVAGLVGTTLVSHRRYATAVRERFGELQAADALRAAARLRAGTPKGSGGTDQRDLFQEAADAQRRQIVERTRFVAYLQHRVALLGSWPTFAAMGFWIVEVVGGGVLGAWIVRRQCRNGALG